MGILNLLNKWLENGNQKTTNGDWLPVNKELLQLVSIMVGAIL
jgi:hypothetical protein